MRFPSVSSVDFATQSAGFAVRRLPIANVGDPSVEVAERAPAAPVRDALGSPYPPTFSDVSDRLDPGGALRRGGARIGL